MCQRCGGRFSCKGIPLDMNHYVKSRQNNNKIYNDYMADYHDQEDGNNDAYDELYSD